MFSPFLVLNNCYTSLLPYLSFPFGVSNESSRLVLNIALFVVNIEILFNLLGDLDFLAFGFQVIQDHFLDD